jgi:tetratricopeptide (TPR) repeat protein
MTADAAEPDVAPQSRAKIFISYSRKDMVFAERLEAALKTRGFEPLIDRTDIFAFEDWWKRIEALIARADTVVFVLSPDSAASEVARKEVAFAASLNKRFAPISLRPVSSDAVPDALAKLNFVSFDGEARFEASADRLAEALDTDIAWIRQHTAFGEQARHWTLANGSRGLLLRSPVLEQAERWIAARPRGAPAPTEETQAFIRASRQDTTRRRNILNGGLATGLVMALGLAGVAYWQRGLAVEQRSIAQQNEAQAKEERDKATRNFRLAQRSAESMVIDIARGLRNVQGMSAETVRKILDTARATFEQLAAAAPDDLALLRSQSLLLEEFGETYQTLGDLNAALKAYRDSLYIGERLAAADPSSPLWQRHLLVAHNNIGNVLAAQGKLDDALKAYRDSLAIAERLAAADPSNPEWQRRLSVSYNYIGAVLAALGKREDALKSYRDGLAIAEQLTAADPSNTEWQRDLSVSHEKVGEELAAQGEFEDALKSYRDSLAIRTRLTAADPSNTLWQRDLSVSYTKVGEALTAQGKLEDALKAYRDSLAIMERLAATDPSNTRWQRDLSVYYSKVGEVLVAQGKLEAALKAYRDSLAIVERLAATDPSNAQWQRDLPVAVNLIGGLAYKFVLDGKFVLALECADQAISLTPSQIWLYLNRAHALMFLGRDDEARAIYLRYRGEQRVLFDKPKPWQTAILEDFAELRQAKLMHPLMDEIEALFASRH